MAKFVFKDLLDRQIKVTQKAGLLILGFFAIVTLLTTAVLKENHPIIFITATLLAVGIINHTLYRWHKNAFYTYQTLIIITVLIIMVYSWYTGGVQSPFVFILTLCPVAAFSTSKKQGFIWSSITISSFLFLYLVKEILPASIVNEQWEAPFFLSSLLFISSLSILMSYLINRSTFAVHRSFERDSEELKLKSNRLDNLTTLMNYSNDLMCIIDIGTLTIEDLNPVFKLHLGYDLSEVRGRLLPKFIEKSEQTSAVFSDMTCMEENEVIEFSCLMVCKNKDTKPFGWIGVARGGKIHASARLTAN